MNTTDIRSLYHPDRKTIQDGFVTFVEKGVLCLKSSKLVSEELMQTVKFSLIGKQRTDIGFSILVKQSCSFKDLNSFYNFKKVLITL